MKTSQYPDGQVFYRRMTYPHPSIVRAEGVYLFGEDGKRYLDGSGGALVVNAGHGVASIAEAIGKQAELFAYIHPTMFTSELIENYTTALSKVTPLPDAKFYPLTSGSEAIEAALKFSRQVQVLRGHPNRHLVIARWSSYHGATLGALAVTGKEKMRKLYRPMFQDMPHIPPPYCYRCPFGLEPERCGLECASALEDEINQQGPENVAAFVAEPVGGATNGGIVPPQGYWPKIKAICDQYDLLLIADEVMTGMGRTGKWFGVEHWNVEADIITIGKGAASGYFPLSLLAVKGQWADLVAEKAKDFDHGGTFSHHSVGMAAGMATLKYLQENHLVERAAARGTYLEKKLRSEIGTLDSIGDVRGLGLMWGMELVADRASKEPYPYEMHLAQAIADEAMRNGLVVYPGSGSVDGTLGDHIMVGPPLCISDAEIDEMVAILKQAVLTVIARS